MLVHMLQKNACFAYIAYLLALLSLTARQHVFEPVFQFGCSLPFHAQPGLVLEHCQVAQLQLVALEYLQISHRPRSQAILCVVHVDLQC